MVVPETELRVLCCHTANLTSQQKNLWRPDVFILKLINDEHRCVHTFNALTLFGLI